jgi:hypothetical protein
MRQMYRVQIPEQVDISERLEIHHLLCYQITATRTRYLTRIAQLTRRRRLSILSTRDSDNEARDARWVRLGIAGFSGILLVSIVASVHLSTLDISFGSIVFGSRNLWRGQSAAFRVAAYHARGTDLLAPIAATFTLGDDAGHHVEVTQGGNTFVETRLPVPDALVNPCRLQVTIDTPDGSDDVSLILDATDRPPPLGGRIASHLENRPSAAPPPSGPLRVAVYPQGGQVVAGLENMISARITLHGIPLATSIDTNEFGIHVESDTLGLFHFPFTPMPQPKTLSFDTNAGRVELPFEVKTTGLLLETSQRGLVRPGADLAISVTTLPFADPTVHIDVWAGGALLLASSRPAKDRRVDVDIGLPRDASGFMRVEAYRNLGADPESRSTQLLWASDSPEADAANELLAALAALPGGDPIIDEARAAPVDRRADLARLALTRFVPETTGPPVLQSTLGARRLRVSEGRESLRAAVHTLFVLTVLAGIGLLLGWVLRHQIRTRRSLRHVLEEGIAAGEAIDEQDTNRLARISHLYDLALTLVTLMLAAYGIFMLMSHIQWE